MKRFEENLTLFTISDFKKIDLIYNFNFMHIIISEKTSSASYVFGALTLP